MKSGVKILNCFAHLDDAEIWVGGTLLKHAKRGDEITTISFANAGDAKISESRFSHNSINAKLITLPYDLTQTKKIANEILGIFISEKPDIVLTHWADDCHLDHRRVFEMCSYAVIKLWIATSRPSAMFCVDTYHSQGLTTSFQPSLYVDISDVWEAKVELISNFRSEPVEYWIKMATLQNSFYGNRIGKSFAEGLLQIPIQGKLTSFDYLPCGGVG